MTEYFTSEYVTCGHPDKIADIISDSLLDMYLEKDKKCKTAIETMVARDHVILAGEVSSDANISNDEIENYINDVVGNYIGYTYENMLFQKNNLKIDNYITTQSKDIYNNVFKKDGDTEIISAGDQGIMFGAADARYDKLTYMPIEWRIANDLAKQLYYLHNKYPNDIYPDGKTQVTCRYSGNALFVDKIIVSFSHRCFSNEYEYIDLKNKIESECIFKVMNSLYYWLNWRSALLFINDSGSFTKCGPDADTGLTGRKIVVDGYGGKFPVGGGAFSGKDASKVDRSGALMARQIAVSLVDTGFVDVACVQLSYQMGGQQPTSVNIKVSNPHDKKNISKWIQKVSKKLINEIDMSPQSIISRFSLDDPNVVHYSDLAKNGHFGRNDLLWEKPNSDIQKVIYSC